MIGKILKFIIKFIFTMLSLGIALGLFPITYLLMVIWYIYVMISTKQNFVELMKETNEMIINDLFKPYMNALIELWEA